MSGVQFNDHLAYAVAPERDRHAAGWVALPVLVTMVVTAFAPMRDLYVGPAGALLACAYSAAAVAMLATAMFLRNEYRATNFGPFAYLATAYGLTGALVFAYVCSLPHVFTGPAFEGVESQTSTLLWVLWHFVFVVLVALHMWSESYFTHQSPEHGFFSVRSYTSYAVILTAFVLVLVVIAAPYLPVVCCDRYGYTWVFSFPIAFSLMAAYVTVLAWLVARTWLKQTSHLWLGVVLLGLLVDVVASALLGNQFDFPWYAGRLVGVMSLSVYLVIQLRHVHQLLASFATNTRSLVEETLRDPLTGLFNVRGFEELFADSLEQCRARRAPLAVVALDLDYFKSFNDYYGHVAGDEALRQVAKTLRSVLNRPGDRCCRTGGEEFTLVLPATDESGALTVAERVREEVLRLKMPHAPTAPMPVMTVSIGLAACDPDLAMQAKALRERADAALYRAKRLGRNRICIAARQRDEDAEPPSNVINLTG